MRKIIALLAFVAALCMAVPFVAASVEYCLYPMPTPVLAPSLVSVGVATNSTGNNVTNYWVLTNTGKAIWHLNKTNSNVADNYGNCTLPAGISTGLIGLWTNATERAPSHFWFYDDVLRRLVGVNRTCHLNVAQGNFSFNTSASQEIAGVWSNRSSGVPTDFWLLDTYAYKIYHVNATGSFAGTDFNCTLPSSMSDAWLVDLWSNNTGSSPSLMWFMDINNRRFYAVNSTCGVVSTGVNSGGQNIVGNNFFGMKGGREFYVTESLSAGPSVVVNPVSANSNAALSVSYLRCANATNFEFTWKGNGYTNLTLDLPWTSGVLTGDKCEYGATFADRITSQNTSLGCVVTINSTKLYQGDTMKVYASVALQTTLPPNLPAAIGATAILGIIVIYKIIVRKKSGGFT